MSSTTFSYAQAAKGHTITQPSPQLTSSTAPMSIKDDTTTTTTSVSAPSVASNDPEIRDLDRSAKSEAEVASSRQDSEVVFVRGPDSSTAAASEHTMKPSRDTTAIVTESQQQPEEKGSRSTSRTSRLNDGPDGRKGRKGRKVRSNEKDSQSEQIQEDEKEKEIPKPVLSEAPPPAVNIWAKRIEAQQQAAKVKATVTPVATAIYSTPSAGQEPKKRQPSEDGDAHAEVVNGVNGDKAQKKSDMPQGTEQVSRRSAPRGSRAVDGDEKSSASLPPVADASFWPDPKAAAATEETTRKPQEKSEPTDKETAEEAGTAKKKWVNFDIIPTVVFNTPMPPRGAKPRGGARGGREAGSARGSHAGAAGTAQGSFGDRSTAASVTVGPKTSTTRPREGSIQPRTPSLPQPALPHATGAPRHQQKTANQTNTEQTRDAGSDVTAASSKRASSVRDIRTEFGQANFDTTPRVSSQERANGGHQKGSEFSKEASHSSLHGQQYSTREGRPDRGRAGFRGRGGHSGGAGSHIASGSYSSNGQYGAHGPFPSRQNGAAPSPPPFGGQFPTHFNQQHRRGSKWAANGQASGRNGANGASFPVKAPQVNDFPVAQYATYVYPQVDMFSVIKRQVEYYLSVENLCKDHYLRQQMDSQGFVHLTTIAGFKRLHELVKELDLIRYACSTSELVDYVVGDDNIERLRNRDKWHSFVLPYNERCEVAQNEGPGHFTLLNGRQGLQMPPFGGPVMHPGFSAAPSPAGVYPYYPEDQMFRPAYGNGIPYEHAVNDGGPNGHRYGVETQLSAGVPEYSPPLSPLTLESMTNFTDAQVENLMVVVDFDKKDAPSAADTNGAAVHSQVDATHDAVNGVSDATEGVSINGQAVNEHVESSSKTRNSGGKPYNEIKQQALEKRSNAQPGETPALMRQLYRFWSRMLLKDFNSNVYNEFRELAMKDASQDVPARCGLRHLLDFYEKLLLDSEGQKPWPQGRAIPGIFQLHFQEALDYERSIGARSEAAI